MIMPVPKAPTKITWGSIPVGGLKITDIGPIELKMHPYWVHPQIKQICKEWLKKESKMIQQNTSVFKPTDTEKFCKDCNTRLPTANTDKDLCTRCRDSK